MEVKRGGFRNGDLSKESLLIVIVETKMFFFRKDFWADTQYSGSYLEPYYWNKPKIG